MGPAFAAVAAGIVALLEATVFSRYQIAGSQLHITLILAIAATVVFGFEEGMTCALVGGLCLDIFTMLPIGSTVFEMLIAISLVMIAEPLLTRSRFPGIVAAALIVTPVFLIISDITTGLLRPPPPALPLRDVLAAGLVNAAAAAVLSLPIIGLKTRAENRERVLWWR